jgi:hypothetical protein
MYERFPFGNEAKNSVFTHHRERAPIFFARSRSAALLILASGDIVVTSVPFRLRMFSMDIASSHRLAYLRGGISPPQLGGMPWKPFPL